MQEGASAERSALRVALAWGVHGFTASGAVVGAAALLAVAASRAVEAGLLMLAALAIDAVDGTLARRVGVEQALPQIDGRRLDDMVDYLNYVVVPAVFMVAFGLLPSAAWAAVPILASAYGFSQQDAKTPDHFFLGFPSYWNVVALYLWLLGTPAVAGAAIVVGLAAAVFVPLRYVYPSHLRVFARTTNVGAALWLVAVGAALLAPDLADRLHLVELSLLYPAWYLGLSFWLTRPGQGG